MDIKSAFGLSLMALSGLSIFGSLIYLAATKDISSWMLCLVISLAVFLSGMLLVLKGGQEVHAASEQQKELEFIDAIISRRFDKKLAEFDKNDKTYYPL